MGAGTITCTMCGRPIPVEFTRVSNASGGKVHMLMAMEPLEAHMRECASTPAQTSAKQVEQYSPRHVKSETDADLMGRIERFLNAKTPKGGRFFVSEGGSRACTMCGLSGPSCMALIGQNTREGCCPACMNGNTHRAPHDDQGCAEWAAEHAPR